jgi:chromosome segregation ATPase
VAIKPIGKASIEIVAKGLEQVTQQLEALRVAVSRLTSDTERDVNKATKAAEDGYKKQEKAAEKAAESVEKLAAKQADAAKKAEEIGKAGRTGFGALDDAVGKAGQKIEDSTQGLRKFQGALSGIIGVVTGLGAVAALAFGTIIAKIRESREEAEEFEKSLEDLRKKGQELAGSFADVGRAEVGEIVRIEEDLARKRFELNKQKKDDLEENLKRQNELTRQIGDRAIGGSPGVLTELRSELSKLQRQQQRANEETEKQIRIIERAAKSAIDRIQSQIDARNAEAAAADLTPILEANRFAEEQANQQTEDNARRRLSLLDGEERVREELAITEAALQEQIRQAEENNNSRLISSLKERLDLEREIAQTRIKGIQDAKDEENASRASGELARAMNRLQKAIEEQAKTANANQRELERLNQKITNFIPAARKIADGVTRRQRP